MEIFVRHGGIVAFKIMLMDKIEKNYREGACNTPAYRGSGNEEELTSEDRERLARKRTKRSKMFWIPREEHILRRW